MSDIEFSYYKNVLSSIHRGWTKGRFSNAKPLYFLAITEGISMGKLLENKFFYDDFLEALYLDSCHLYEPELKVAPFYRPFYHSNREEYYNILWKGGSVPAHTWHTPSAKFLREHVEYAFLDNKLWSLLQDSEIREALKQSVIKRYLAPNQ